MGSIPIGPINNSNDIDDKDGLGEFEKQKHTYKSVIQFTNGQEFFDYIDAQQYPKNHVLHLKTYFKRHLENKTFNSPFELQQYVQQNKGIRHITKTARVYLNYCEKFELVDMDIIAKYRKFLKLKASKPDVYVPSNAEVIENYNKIKSHPALEIVYLVLMTSGIRYTECLDFLSSYDTTKFRINDDFVSYSVANLRHTKNINNIYLPLFVYNKLIHVDQSGLITTLLRASRLSFGMEKW